MKAHILLLVFLLCSFVTLAQQKIEKHIDFSGKETLNLKIQIADSINIHTWNKNELFISASININDNKDNEAYTTSFEETGNSVVVDAKFKDKYFKGKNNCCNQTDIYWQVFVPEKASFNIETINANITIDGQTNQMKVKSISGYIDLAVPVSRKADLEFSTISGTIYSNHELALNKKKGGVPSVIKEKMNSGGLPIKLETISGDIFFRKSN
jgi:DUF4097 and DUF4098 domain-containing protein YvlB